MSRILPKRPGFTPFALALMYLLSSCVNTKHAIYFNNVPDSLSLKTSISTPQLINPNDILNITVSSPNPQAAEVFNNMMVGTSAYTNLNNGQPIGFLVDQDGYVQYPILGKIKAAGMTKRDFTEYLRNQLIDKKLLIDPVVAVRFANFRITVLGEVSRPAVVSVPSEKISILEALGMAGDLTIYARRDNVLIIREEENQRVVKRIDLTSKNLLTSPYYFLRSNDVVYVEPNKAKIASVSNTRQVLPIIFSGLSVLVVILDRVTRKN